MKKFFLQAIRLDRTYILLIVVFYFIIFFSLKDKLLFNPDFGLSDTYHGLGAPVKYYLSQQLKQGKIPFWSDKWLGGFPFFSEWQVGSLHIPNLIFLKFFSFANGYNLTLISAFFFLSLGFYLILREFKVNSLLSLLISLNFALNGANSFRLSHANILQTFSLAPLLIFIMIKYLKEKKKRYLILFPFILSQMILAGFVQITFIAVLGLYLFVALFLTTFQKQKLVKIISVFLLISILIGIALGLSMPQILPSLQLGQMSIRKLQLDFSLTTEFPLQFKNLIAFVKPFAFGNPKYGTYPPFSADWGIFWEDTPYIGMIPALLLLFALSTIILNKNKMKKFILANMLAAFLFILLALGKNSPLYFLFEIPPFNFFRTQSRFLIMANFFIFFILALSLDFIYKRTHVIFKTLIGLFLFVNLAHLLWLNKDYHLFIDAKKYLAVPALAKKIEAKHAYLTLGQEKEWNEIFLKRGWAKKKDVENYLFFKNFLFPNSNLYFNQRVFDIYNGAGFKPARQEYLKTLLITSLEIEKEKVVATKKALNLMKLLDVRYLILPMQTRGKDLKKLDEAKFGSAKIFLSEYNSAGDAANPIFYIPEKIESIQTLNEFYSLFLKDRDFTDEAVIENLTQSEPTNKNFQIKVQIKSLNDEYLKIVGNANRSGMIVIRKNYYPGWEAYLDGKKVAKWRANLVHTAVRFPKGRHVLELKYENRLFQIGMLISLASFIGLIASGIVRN